MYPRKLLVEEIQYHALVELTYRMTAIFSFGIPLVLLFWSSIKKEASIFRLLSIYWKVASLIAISILLLTSQQPVGYLTSFISPILIIGSIWFWVDLNEEISEMPPWKALPLTVKIWRWSLSFLGMLYIPLTFGSLHCFNFKGSPICNSWIKDPQNLHQFNKLILDFLFGGNWTELLAGFIGYIALTIYIIGIIQWILIRFPKQGRVAGNF
tara:strand:+ start:1716 stop:2348 length:633 start_codon:yes stop_codon:yes gene_type:complete